MPELIDRQAALRLCKDADWEDDRIFIAGYNHAIRTMTQAITELPTIESEERHGRWIQRRNGEYYCTNCGREEKFIFQKNYCPRCGARMDATDTNVGGKGDEEMDLSPLDFLAAEYDRKHPQGIRFVDCMEGADDGACKKV